MISICKKGTDHFLIVWGKFMHFWYIVVNSRGLFTLSPLFFTIIIYTVYYVNSWHQLIKMFMANELVLGSPSGEVSHCLPIKNCFQDYDKCFTLWPFLFWFLFSLHWISSLGIQAIKSQLKLNALLLHLAIKRIDYPTSST